MRRIDLTGQLFGKLLVIGPAPNLGSSTRWKVRCECGNETLVASLHLRSGRQTACGCQRTSHATAEIHRKLATKHGNAAGVNKRPSPTYQSWSAMWRRCTCPKSVNYHRYGGKGISVCMRWQDFEMFLADMGERPPGTSIDRYPNRNGNYEPGNCRWATAAQQARNRDDTKATPDIVREIRVKMAKGESARALAKRFGLSRASVTKINNRESWKECD